VLSFLALGYKEEYNEGGEALEGLYQFLLDIGKNAFGLLEKLFLKSD
jgi:hypothetical protein